MIIKYHFIGFILSMVVNVVLLLNFKKINNINRTRLKRILSIIFITILIFQIITASLIDTQSGVYIIVTWVSNPIGLYSSIYIILSHFKD